MFQRICAYLKRTVSEIVFGCSNFVARGPQVVAEEMGMVFAEFLRGCADLEANYREEMGKSWISKWATSSVSDIFGRIKIFHVCVEKQSPRAGDAQWVCFNALWCV